MRNGTIAASLLSITLLSLVAAATAAGAAGTPAEAPRYSASALYNMGNAYARDGKPGMAVLNYERAGLLAPGDPDIEANLNFVRRAAKITAPPPTRFERLFEFASPTTLAWAGIAGLLLAGCCWLAGHWTRYRRWRIAGILTGIALTAVTVCNGIALWPAVHAAVILHDATPVRVSPVPMGDALFTLREAETVTLTDEHEGFMLIRTAAGRTGWVAAADLAAVVPRS